MSDVQDENIEDIEACAKEGRRPRDTGPYRVLIGDALFEFQPVVVDGPIQTGRALRELAALQPPEHYICFAILADGLLEEIRLEETIDLRAGVERFIAFKSDRMFRFTINGTEFQWGGAFITGATLLKLAKLNPDSHAVSVKLADGSQAAVASSSLIDLAGPGVEEFVTTRTGA